MLVSIAWRNLWRNRRRTIVTLLAVAGGLTGMLTMHAFMSGLGGRMLEGLLGSSLGHVQVHRLGYRERGGATRTVHDADLVLAAVRHTTGVRGAAGRISSVAHASIVRGADEDVRGGGGEELASPFLALIGLEPNQEGRVTDIPTKVVEGRWFQGEAEVLIGEALAKRHHIQIGDAILPTAVDMNGARRGPWAAGDQVPRVVGIMRTGVEPYDGRVAFMPRAYLSKLLNMQDQIHEIAIRAENPEQLDDLCLALRRSIAEARSRDPNLAVRASLPLVFEREEQGDRDGGSNNQPVTVRLVGAEPGTAPSGAAPGLEGQYLSRAEDLVLTKSAATALGVSPGDRVLVTVPVDCGEDLPEPECPPTEEPFVVAGVVDETQLLDGSFALVSAQVLGANIAALAPRVVNELGEEDRAALAALTARLRGSGAGPDEVLPWTELAPDLYQMLSVLDVMPVVFFVVIFFAVALGIVNTMLMATFERTREIGLMRAVGMRASQVVAMVLWESFLLALVGIAAGLALGMPLVWYWETYGMNMGALMTQEQSFDFNGITIDPTLWPKVSLGNVVSAVITVGLMTALSGLWPALRAARLPPTKALRQE